MAARRGKSQATRNSSQATPAWVWLILGLLIGLAIYFIAPGLMKKDGDGFFRPQPNPDAQPAPIDSADVDAVVPETPATDAGGPATAAPADDAAAKETQYDFYTLLPGKEVQMSDAELAASAREEEARKARAALAGNAPVPAASTNTPGTPATAPQPTPISETAATTTTATAPPATASSNNAPPKPATVASADNNARYILQAGAFGASGDAEATKAKIALLGLSARVESAQINGKTVYRVRMGPYGTAGELAEAKQKLASGGLPAMAIKAQ